MHGTIETGRPNPRPVRRRHNDWTLREHGVVVDHWPDIEAISKLLPHRTRVAIASFAGKCNLRNPLHAWTTEEHRTLVRLVGNGSSRKAIAQELRLTVTQIANRMRYTGVKYGRRPPEPTGNILRDQIFLRAYQLNLSRADLDEACNSGSAFQKLSPTRKIALKHLAKAVEIMDGHLSVRWSELDS